MSGSHKPQGKINALLKRPLTQDRTDYSASLKRKQDDVRRRDLLGSDPIDYGPFRSSDIFGHPANQTSQCQQDCFGMQ